MNVRKCQMRGVHIKYRHLNALKLQHITKRHHTDFHRNAIPSDIYTYRSITIKAVPIFPKQKCE